MIIEAATPDDPVELKRFEVFTNRFGLHFIIGNTPRGGVTVGVLPEYLNSARNLVEHLNRLADE